MEEARAGSRSPDTWSTGWPLPSQDTGDRQTFQAETEFQRAVQPWASPLDLILPEQFQLPPPRAGMNLSCLVLPLYFTAVWSPLRDAGCQEESDASHGAQLRVRCLAEAP